MEIWLLAIGAQLAAGLGAMVVSKWPRAATAIGAGGAVVACSLVLGPTWHVLLGTIPDSLNIEWDATHGTFRLGVDALSACFLLPLLVLSPLAAVYGGSYLLVDRQQKSLGPPWFFFNLFVAAMELVVIARSAMLFLMAWEVMSLAAYGLVTFEHEKTAVRRAGWIYLVATHLGMACLIAMFTLLGSQVGRLDFDLSFGLPSVAPGVAAAVFLLAVVGFGTKAGFVPFHVWLPEAHPAAPSHVSALMSGVMIKLGIYGLLRI
ncbi:MAG TPA: proton-conducting transporter membrane subunit, partial [Pirellulales bacterium]|nr:proton-conducting transporter membrane subunit [Pirellulales bacterium]